MATLLAVHDRWKGFREQMPVANRWAYFDHAAVAPISLPAQRVVLDWAREATDEGDTLWPQWNSRLQQVRRTAARLLGANADEVALVHNTTQGISLVAEGYPWQPGDNVVTLDDEFPSNQYPWLNLASRGVETRRLATDRGRVDLGQLAAACDERTRIVSLSWIGYATGFRHDVAAVADVVHSRGALFFLDAIQGLGVFPLDVNQAHVDFAAADGHKWLLGPEGAGLLYIRREHLPRLRPLEVGWNSVVHAHDYSRIEFNLKPSASRYEGGTRNMAGFLALGASIELLLDLGIEAIGERVLLVTDLACEKLARAGGQIISHRGGPERSGIVSFEMPGRDPVELRRQCLARGVVLSCRAGRLRISPHAYNNEEDLDRLVAALA